MPDSLSTIVSSLQRIQTEGRDITDNHVIFTADKNKGYYIQFATGQDEAGSTREAIFLYAEAVGNTYLKPQFRLSQDQEARLQSLGWNPPDGNGNFWRTWRAADDIDRQEVAQQVVRTFEDVYGVFSNQPLAVELQMG